jgi:hypothetical protein
MDDMCDIVNSNEVKLVMKNEQLTSQLKQTSRNGKILFGVLVAVTVVAAGVAFYQWKKEQRNEYA